MKKHIPKKVIRIASIVVFFGICGMIKTVYNFRNEAKESLYAGTLAVIILFAIFFYLEVAKYFKHCKDQHHSGMDINKTKEKL